VVERVAVDPACAEAWRVAHELQESQREELSAVVPLKPRSWTPAWLGLAAGLVAIVGIGMFQITRAPVDTYRTETRYVIESPVSSDAALPRDAFVLRWTPGPDGTLYQVSVTTEDLMVLTTARDISVAEYRVPVDRLAKVPAGSRVLWQIVASLPGGERVSSQTFVARIQ
jgi:hypothetical protein